MLSDVIPGMSSEYTTPAATSSIPNIIPKAFFIIPSGPPHSGIHIMVIFIITSFFVKFITPYP